MAYLAIMISYLFDPTGGMTGYTVLLSLVHAAVAVMTAGVSFGWRLRKKP